MFLIRSVALKEKERGHQVILKEKERGHQVILMSSRRIGVGLFCVSIVCFCSVVVLSRARDVQLDLAYIPGEDLEHARARTHARTHKCTHIHKYTHTHTHTRTHTKHTVTHTRTLSHAHTYYTNVCVYIYLYLSHTRTLMYINLYTRTYVRWRFRKGPVMCVCLEILCARAFASG